MSMWPQYSASFSGPNLLQDGSVTVHEPIHRRGEEVVGIVPLELVPPSRHVWMDGAVSRKRFDGRLLEFTQQQLECSPSGDAPWRGLPELSVARHKIV